MKINMKFITILICFSVNSILLPQIKTNFEVVDSLLKKSGKEISKDLETNSEYYLNFIAPNDYTTLENKLIEAFQKENLKISTNDLSPKINYSLDQIKLNYSDIFRDGLFGSFLVKRSTSLSGSWYINDEVKLGDTESFVYTFSDTISYSEISLVENIAYSFTTSEIPEEPFFSSSVEPAIALGSAAIAIYLFFNIRSK